MSLVQVRVVVSHPNRSLADNLTVYAVSVDARQLSDAGELGPGVSVLSRLAHLLDRYPPRSMQNAVSTAFACFAYGFRLLTS